MGSGSGSVTLVLSNVSPILFFFRSNYGKTGHELSKIVGSGSENFAGACTEPCNFKLFRF